MQTRHIIKVFTDQFWIATNQFVCSQFSFHSYTQVNQMPFIEFQVANPQVHQSLDWMLYFHYSWCNSYGVLQVLKQMFSFCYRKMVWKCWWKNAARKVAFNSVKTYYFQSFTVGNCRIERDYFCSKFDPNISSLPLKLQEVGFSRSEASYLDN